MKILNLYAGLGGNRTYWNDHEITAIELNPIIANVYQKRFPSDKMIIQDVFDFLQNESLEEFDFIWSSPPCQTHSHMQIFTKNSRTLKFPKINETVGLALWLNRCFEKAFVVENVIPWYGIIDLSHRNIYHVILNRQLTYSNFYIPHAIFKKGNNKYGEIGGIMRKTRSTLMQEYSLGPWILDDLKGVHDKDQIIRNCVDPKIGKYILDHIQQKKLSDFFTALPPTTK